MKSTLLFILPAFLTGLHQELKAQHMANKPVMEVLQNLSDKLESTKNISYDHYRGIHYFSENYHHEISGKAYFDFLSKDTVLGIKCQYENDQLTMVFNGAESFILNKTNKTMQTNISPNRNSISSWSFLLNSLVTLKRALPGIIDNREIEKSLTDTLIKEKPYYLVTLIIKNKYLGTLGDLIPVTEPRNFNYKIVIDQENNLPLYIIQANNIEPKDYLLTSFTNYQVNNNSRPENSWYFSTFTHAYKQEDKMVENLLKPGSVAPDWSLPVYSSNNNLKLSQLKGKMVLLEFWIKNCGYCIAAVPKINALAKKYKGRKFQVIGINAHDTKEEVETFIKRNNPSYQTVYASGKLCSDYGVMAYPSFFLIDKKGLILYSGPLEPETFERLLETQLKQK